MKTERENDEIEEVGRKKRHVNFLQISQVLKIYNLLQSWNSGARHPLSLL
jgi:hypothetical protein